MTKAIDILRRCKELFEKGLVGIPIGQSIGSDWVDDVEIDINNFLTGYNEITLGSCYHTGLAYSLAYDAHGMVELSGKTFTNLDTGVDGGAMAALKEYQRNLNPDRDVPFFIVALKPVKIYRPPDLDVCDDCFKWKKDCACDENDTTNSGCNCLDGNCDDDCCENCGELYEHCQGLCLDNYDPCDECGSSDCDCWVYQESYCQNCGLVDYKCFCPDGCRCNNEVVAPPLNAFDRARFLKA
ncbi:hypothetical protein LCGC14_0220960 [marine sediment metagenome]|uniref:Uncharacterized protein n=1 Tax=marine sediment metagenome TaxID=412755 RepID=A0A0F9XH35_9ZZZZ